MFWLEDTLLPIAVHLCVSGKELQSWPVNRNVASYGGWLSGEKISKKKGICCGLLGGMHIGLGTALRRDDRHFTWIHNMICFFVVVCFLLVDQNRWDSEAIARRNILSSSSSADNAAPRLQVMLHSMRLCNRNSCLSHRSWLRHLISTCSLTTIAHFCVPKWKPCFWGSWCSTCLEQPRLENVSCSLSKTKPVASWKMHYGICHGKHYTPWVPWSFQMVQRGASGACFAPRFRPGRLPVWSQEVSVLRAWNPSAV